MLALISSVNALAAAQSPMGADRVPLFGETHMHTAFSLDAFMFGTRATPDEAYDLPRESRSSIRLERFREARGR